MLNVFAMFCDKIFLFFTRKDVFLFMNIHMCSMPTVLSALSTVGKYKRKLHNMNNQKLVFIAKVIHLVAVIHFSFGVYYDHAHVNVPKELLRSKAAEFGGKFKYLTFINGVNAQCIRYLLY